jgi:tRNA modification GTPase
MDDTIAAISTPIGEGGIAIIRISGPNALVLADRIFHSRDGRVSEFPSHTLHFGTIGRDGETIDQVMLGVLHGPRTYTKEDTIEINCHGGVLTARKTLALCLQSGARLAEPGEFTKRAFLNGRLDLTQAEAVMDLIRAKSDRAHTAAVHELEGYLSKKIDRARDKLITILAHIEAHIDFPEDDIAPETRETLLRETEVVLDFIRALLATAREGKILREGISVAIVGRPNVGKSSLMNALIGSDRSIVTSVPGTTRDTIEENACISGVLFRLTDTAGIRKTRGAAEQIGVERSRKALDISEIVLLVLDSSKSLSAADRELAKQIEGNRLLLVLNKADLSTRLRLPDDMAAFDCVKVSATIGTGLDALRDKLVGLAYSGKVGTTDVDVAINERQNGLLKYSENYLTETIHSFNSNRPLEIIAQQLRHSLNVISEITGKIAAEDILSKIFSTFCIGK